MSDFAVITEPVDGLALLGTEYSDNPFQITFHQRYTGTQELIPINWTTKWNNNNKRVSQMRAPLVTHREPAGDAEQAAKCAICFWT